MSDRAAVPYDVLKAGLCCPRCVSPLTGHVPQADGARPTVGDYTLCWYCEELLRYRAGNFGWRLESSPWPSGDVETMEVVSDMYAKMRAAKGAGQSARLLGQDVAERDGQR